MPLFLPLYCRSFCIRAMASPATLSLILCLFFLEGFAQSMWFNTSVAPTRDHLQLDILWSYPSSCNSTMCCMPTSTCTTPLPSILSLQPSDSQSESSCSIPYPIASLSQAFNLLSSERCTLIPILFGSVPSGTWRVPPSPLPLNTNIRVNLNFPWGTGLTRTIRFFPPGPVSNVEFSTTATGLTTVTWAAPSETSNVPTTVYIVTTLPGGTLQCVSPGDASNCTYPMPFVGGGHRFTVTAQTLIGPGIMSSPSMPIPDGPSVPVVTIRNGEAHIAFNVPLNALGVVSYSVLSIPSVEAVCVFIGATECVFPESKFNPRKNYQFRASILYDTGLRSFSATSDVLTLNQRNLILSPCISPPTEFFSFFFHSNVGNGHDCWNIYRRFFGRSRHYNHDSISLSALE